MNEGVLLRVKKVMVNIRNTDIVQRVVPETGWEQLGFDSLQTIDFITALENEFGFAIPDEDLLAQQEWMGTVSSIVVYIKKQLISGKGS